jgi:hypothetical protein
MKKLSPVVLLVLLVASAAEAAPPSVQAPKPTNESCRPISGLADLMRPGIVLLLGELHGTAESPAFAGEVACNIAQAGYPVVLGLELAPSEQERVDLFLASAGAASDRKALIAGTIWQREYQDGRNSIAMVELIERARLLEAAGLSVRIALFDAAYNRDRDARMAEALSTAARENEDGITVVLTGNRHSQTSGSGEPAAMGSSIVRAIGADKVVSLDVAHDGGTSWLCYATTEGQECGIVKLRRRGPEGLEPSTIVVPGSPRARAHNGWYFVGAITASKPARMSEP